MWPQPEHDSRNMEVCPLLHNSDVRDERSSIAEEGLLLHLTVVRGRSLVIKDLFRRSSDPYVIVTSGNQKEKTKIIWRNLNPEWNAEMTLTITDPSQPIRFEVFDKDTFTSDDAMGSAELDIKPFIETIRTHRNKINDGATRKPGNVAWGGGKLTKDIVLDLKLNNHKCGELVLQLSAS